MCYTYSIKKGCAFMENRWEQLKKACMSCTQCDLCQTRTNVVFGMGNPHAEVLFVGEGPGANEDEQGKPFVGRSGKLLDTFLEGANLSREKNIFIANIVKCRPPQNRDPSPNEREACLPWLREQFKIIRPKIIICLGRVAAQVMIRPDFAIMKEHGQWVEKNGVYFMAMLHPAAILRNPNNKQLAIDDFVTLQEKIKEICVTTY